MSLHRFAACWFPPLEHRVLLIHDDRHFAAAVQQLLSRDERFQLVAVDTAFEAGRMLRSHAPEVVVVRTWMPELDVAGMLRQVRQNRSFDGLRVLCLADGGQSAEAAPARAAADEVLPNGSGPRAVVAAVYRHLGLVPPTGEISGWNVMLN